MPKKHDITFHFWIEHPMREETYLVPNAYLKEAFGIFWHTYADQGILLGPRHILRVVKEDGTEFASYEKVKTAFFTHLPLLPYQEAIDAPRPNDVGGDYFYVPCPLCRRDLLPFNFHIQCGFG